MILGVSILNLQGLKTQHDGSLGCGFRQCDDIYYSWYALWFYKTNVSLSVYGIMVQKLLQLRAVSCQCASNKLRENVHSDRPLATSLMSPDPLAFAPQRRQSHLAFACTACYLWLVLKLSFMSFEFIHNISLLTDRDFLHFHFINCYQMPLFFVCKSHI